MGFPFPPTFWWAPSIRTTAIAKESPLKLVGVEYPKASVLKWPANILPIHLAFGPRCLVRTEPKESSLELVDVVKDGWWDDQWGGGVDHLGSDHGLDKGRTSNGGDVLAIIL